MQRRSFLSAILVGATAPAIVRASSLMQVKPIWPTAEEIIALDFAEELAKSIDLTREYYIERVKLGKADPHVLEPFVLYDVTPETLPGVRHEWPYKPDEAVVPPGWMLVEKEKIGQRYDVVHLTPHWRKA